MGQMVQRRHQWRSNRRTYIVSLFYIAFSAIAGVFALSDAAIADLRVDSDYPALQTALGASLPTGHNVLISQVEAPEGTSPNGSYLPDENSGAFIAGIDPHGEGLTVIDETGCGPDPDLDCLPSAHATAVVGFNFYGNTTSLAPGANVLSVYEANDWLNSVLKLSSPNTQLPIAHDFRVENFSWVGNFPTLAEDEEALERFDYLIDTNNITAVVGLNLSGNPLPTLLSHSYNAIAAGRSDGGHSAGVTQSFYGPGRNKPDIVISGGTPSQSTAFVSSAATLLHEAATMLPNIGQQRVNAAMSETIKATLFAGATKEEFPGWSHSVAQPLDSTFGVGELNIYNSYFIQAGGQQAGSIAPPTAPVPNSGWDYQTINAGSTLLYDFDVQLGDWGKDLSIVLAWNAEVTYTGAGTNPNPFVGTVSLDDLNLRLIDTSTGLLVDPSTASESTVDNVEHIFLNDLTPGSYRLELSSNGTRDFGLAWRLDLLDGADFNEDGKVDGADFLSWQLGFGTLSGASHSDGDANGDGAVDAADLAIFTSSYPSPAISLAAATVPEPGALALLVSAFLSLTLLAPSRSSRMLSILSGLNA